MKAKVVATLSKTEYCRMAEITPIGIATSTEMR
ncbi:hypothetical protein HRbin26_00488 [bacterium HR26]|nr:hypothetical protein HRbin26_00488 [bacterium HR26]